MTRRRLIEENAPAIDGSDATWYFRVLDRYLGVHRMPADWAARLAYEEQRADVADLDPPDRVRALDRYVRDVMGRPGPADRALAAIPQNPAKRPTDRTESRR